MPMRGANVLMGGLKGRFDGHAHVFNASPQMDENRRYTPKRDAPLSDYLDLLQASKLDGAILIQPSFLGTDNSYLLNALARKPATENISLRGVIMLDPFTPKKQIARMGDAGIIGLRLNLLGNGQNSAFNIDVWKQLFRAVSDIGWHVELHCEGEDLAYLLPAVVNYSDCVVVDHFGLPDTKNPLKCPGQEAILHSSFERLFVKVSAPYRVFPEYSSERAAELCEPVFQRLLETLGPERLLWGSDWPWTQFENRHDYASAVDWERRWLNVHNA